MHSLRFFARHILPLPLRRWLVQQTRWPRVGSVQPDNLWRIAPVSRSWGGDRGKPIDRYYIEQFLASHAADIQGRVLEIGDNAYTLRFGGDRVLQSDVMNVLENYPGTTIVADLTQADHVPSDSFDCIICTQTLQHIFDTQSALRTLHRLLKPGAVLLITVPGISQIDQKAMEQWGDYWRFTALSSRRLCEELFTPECIEVCSRGNVLSAISFLHGLAAEELTTEELDYSDRSYQMLITVRAIKSSR